MYDTYQCGRSMFLFQFLTSKKKLIVSLQIEFERGEPLKQSYDLSQLFEGYCKGEVKGNELIQ